MGRRRNRAGRRRRGKNRKHSPEKAEPTFSNLSEEIIIEILSKLHLNSLLRFTCVSKQWRSLIFEIFPKITGRKIVLAETALMSGKLTFHSIDEDSHVKPICIPWKESSFNDHKRIFSSCNGLLLVNIGDDLFLWNPLTKYFKKMISYEPLWDDGYHVVCGLCYDSSTNDYKALMALSHESPDYGGEFVVVGSFRSKIWRRVGFPYYHPSEQLGPIVNGHLHWYVSKKSSGHFLPTHQIVYFNPLKNMFNKVPMPEPKLRAEGDMILGLGVLDGCLCMVRDENPGKFEGYSVEVLAMKEYGMKNSWTILFSVSNSTLRVYQFEPLCYTRNGEALITVFMDGIDCSEIRAYNPKVSSHRKISLEPKCYNVNTIMYEESLVTPTV